MFFSCERIRWLKYQRFAWFNFRFHSFYRWIIWTVLRALSTLHDIPSPAITRRWAAIFYSQQTDDRYLRTITVWICAGAVLNKSSGLVWPRNISTYIVMCNMFVIRNAKKTDGCIVYSFFALTLNGFSYTFRW